MLNLISSFVVSMPFYLTNLSANPAPLFQSAGLSAGGHLGALWGGSGMWEEEEENLKISSTPNLAEEAAAVVLQSPALLWCSTCAVVLHSTEEIQHFHQHTGELKLFSIMCFSFS